VPGKSPGGLFPRPASVPGRSEIRTDARPVSANPRRGGPAKVSSFGRGGLHSGSVRRPPSPRRQQSNLDHLPFAPRSVPQSGGGAARRSVRRRRRQAQAWMPERSRLRVSRSLEGVGERPASGVTGGPGRYHPVCTQRPRRHAVAVGSGPVPTGRRTRPGRRARTCGRGRRSRSRPRRSRRRVARST